MWRGHSFFSANAAVADFCTRAFIVSCIAKKISCITHWEKFKSLHSTCFVLQAPIQSRLIFHLSVAERAQALDTRFPGLFSLNVCWSAVCQAAAVTVLAICWYWLCRQLKSVHFPFCQVNTVLLLAQRDWSLITQSLQLYMALDSKTKQSGQMKCFFVLQINEVSGAVLILDRQMY